METIKVFLYGSDFGSIVKCSMDNWTGLLYKIPWTKLQEARSIDELNRAGVYFLFGNDHEQEAPKLYVGQASVQKNNEGVLNRIIEHTRNPNKEWWKEAFIITSSNNFLCETEITYLENYFCNLAEKSERGYIVDNKNEPHTPLLPEGTVSTLHDFIAHTRMILAALGCNAFEPIVDISQATAKQANPILYYKTAKVDAQGKMTGEGFVILKGSKVATVQQPSANTSIKRKREEYQSALKDGCLTEDLLFDSPSGAASFAAYSPQNGNITWKTKDGKTIPELVE